MGIGILISIVMQALIATNVAATSYVVWALYAFFSFFAMLGYTAISMHFPGEYAARSSTGVNFILFSTTFVLQYLFGLISVTSMVAAFWVFITLQIVALIWFCFGKVGRYG